MDGQTIKPGAADTGGLLTLTEVVLGPRAPLTPPRTLDSNGLLYVVEGRLLVQEGQDRAEIGAGRFMGLAKGFPHSFANVSASPARALEIAYSDGLEKVVRSLVEYLTNLQGPPDLAEMAGIGSRHGARVVRDADQRGP